MSLFALWSNPGLKAKSVQGVGQEARTSIMLTRSKMLHFYPLSFLGKQKKFPNASYEKSLVTLMSLTSVLWCPQPVTTAVLHGCPQSCYSGDFLYSAWRTCFSSCWPALTAEKRLGFVDWRTWILHGILYPHLSCPGWATRLINLYMSFPFYVSQEISR